MKSSVLYAQLNENCTTALPSKLYEYSSIGLPIIYCGPNGPEKSFVENLENAISIPPNDVKALVQAIIKCKKMSNVVSNKNRDLIKQDYIREIIAKKNIHVINRYIG